MTKKKKYKNGKDASPAAEKKLLEIRFYRSNEKPYGVFSNLYPSPVRFETKLYPTAEHAYQAGKARKPEVRDWILSAPTPALAAMAAHGLYVWDVMPKWAEIKYDRMRRVLRAKFDQHPKLREILIGTGDARLVEAGTVNNAVNRLWGEVNGVGQNMLGVMLMELRTELRASPNQNLSKKKKAKTSASRRNSVGYTSAAIVSSG
jgi:ribA/ribD-fused uncharacterized protein